MTAPSGAGTSGTRRAGRTGRAAGASLDGEVPGGEVPDGEVPVNPWYKRRAWLISAALVAVVAVTVLTDLPQHNSRAGQITDDTSVMSQVNTDIGPCSYALGESLTIYHDLNAQTLTPSQVHQVPGLLEDDQNACSFTDDSIYQLSTIDIPGSASGKYIGQVVNTVTLWATSDALAAIEEIQTIDANPADTTARSRLGHFEQVLTHDRAQAESELGAADSLLQTHLPALDLAQVPASSSS
jgi:hypothetical protein